MTSKQKTLENTDLSHYRGEWITYDPESKVIVSNAGSLKVAKELAAAKGKKRVVVMEVPKSGLPFSGFTSVHKR